MGENKLKKSSKKTQFLILLAICLLLLAVLVICLFIDGSKKQDNIVDEPQAINEVISEESGVIESTQPTPRMATSNTTKTDIDPYELVASEIELLKSKDVYTVEKYFGKSDIFTPESVGDKLTATVVSFMSSEELEDSTKVVIHICTLDYVKMKNASETIKSEIEASDTSEDIDDTTKKEVAKGVVKGQFDIHYNIPVIVKNCEVAVTEELKQAITGNWYKGIGTELKTVDCPLSK